MNTLTAVVPIFNEINFLKDSIDSLIKANICERIIIVDDSSTDGSFKAILDNYSNNKMISIYQTDSNSGKGFALNLAFKYLTTSHVIIHDGDLEYNPVDIIPMKDLSNQFPDSLILGSRFIGELERINLYKRTYFANNVMSKFFSLINLYKVSDVATCYKLLPSNFVKDILLKERGFSIEIELISKFLKYNKSIVESPITYRGRSYEEGKKIKTSDGFKYLYNTVKYRFLN